MNIDNTMDAQLQNWNNFCRYHLGDWHGTWTRYSLGGKAVDSFKCVRSFQISADGSEIIHQNYYTYADGKIETKNFGTYIKPVTKALFLDNCFSLGSTTVKSGSNFGFETGFRYENRGVSAAAIYDNSGKFQRITIISEYLASLIEETTSLPANELNGNWRGTLKTMTPELIISPGIVTAWQQLEELDEHYLLFHFPAGISVSCPQQIESGKEFFLAVDWLVNPALLQRGIRHYDSFGFTNLNLFTFIKL